MERRREPLIAILALLTIGLHLLLRFLHADALSTRLPLELGLLLGLPLLVDLISKLRRGELGADLLAAIAILVSALLGEYLAGVLVVVMLASGQTLEAYAVRNAASVLHALSKRVPAMAHRSTDRGLVDIPLDEVSVGDLVVILPHEISPVDGVVEEGRGVMDESYLTGEPFRMSKAPGSDVLSGAINGDAALTVRATRRAVDSRYAQIMRVMRATEQQRPQLRRLGDRLGAVYGPLSLVAAIAVGVATGDPRRCLAVLVVATPCPLLIGIPVAIIGSISLAARRSIIVRDPSVLEVIDTCRTMILDKTGTLTYGKPTLVEQLCEPGYRRGDVLRLVAGIEQYSRHPLAAAILAAAEEEGMDLPSASAISELPGEGLVGRVEGRLVRVVGRKALEKITSPAVLPPSAPGLECLILVDGEYVAAYRFRDVAREESRPFVSHLGPKHSFRKVMLVSGDREAEVRHLAQRVGIQEVYGGRSPEQKAAIVADQVRNGPTVFVGDGINDAPALMTATIGIALGHQSDITSQAAGAVIMESSVEKVDELFHIGRRMRTIALQSAVGGMALSVVGMVFAAMGALPPVAGAVVQEVIDLAAILNALRAGLPPRRLSDMTPGSTAEAHPARGPRNGAGRTSIPD